MQLVTIEFWQNKQSLSSLTEDTLWMNHACYDTTEQDTFIAHAYKHYDYLAKHITVISATARS